MNAIANHHNARNYLFFNKIGELPYESASLVAVEVSQNDTSVVSQNETLKQAKEIIANQHQINNSVSSHSNGVAGRWLNQLREKPKITSPLATQAVQKVDQTSPDSPAKELEALLVHCEELLRNESSSIKPLQIAEQSERARLLAQYRREIVIFLSESQPGLISENAKEIILSKDLLQSQGEFSIDQINHEIMQELSQRYK
ncbi:MAG: hypothetical protein JW841_06195 [Deltaproteobacteria bacterium]|nr:hypothetical protein [Deltaproteobacteria bacterium]